MHPPDAPRALSALRDATASRHDAIERQLGLRAPFGLAHYGRILQGFAAFLAAWEPRVAGRVAGQPCEPWVRHGRRLHLLHRDLQALGLAPRPAAHTCMPRMESTACAVGSLYVLEGSALGGQFIAARAHKLLGLSPQHGTAYFHGAGSGTAARWREFQRLAADHLDGAPQACERATRAAVQTFDGLATVFRDLLDERAVA